MNHEVAAYRNLLLFVLPFFCFAINCVVFTWRFAQTINKSINDRLIFDCNSMDFFSICFFLQFFPNNLNNSSESETMFAFQMWNL